MTHPREEMWPNRVHWPTGLILRRRWLVSAILVALVFHSAHPSEAGGPPTNKLAKASSPYILEAATQPVAWYP